MTTEEKLTTAKLHIARLILWSNMLPDKDGSYDYAKRIYQEASDFLADDNREIQSGD